MGSNCNYYYAVARIRVLEKSLLSDSDISMLISLKDEDAVLSGLRERGWGDASGQNDAASMLTIEAKKTWDLMEELHVDAAAFRILEYPNLYHNLKTAIKEVCTSRNDPLAFSPSGEYGGKEMMRIVREKDFDALPEHMRACAPAAYEAMLHSRDGQLCDILVDRACLEAISEEGRKSRTAVVIDYARTYVASADIKIAARAVLTKKNIDFLYKALAPCSSINVRHLAMAAAGGEEAFLSFLEQAGFAEAAEALKESPSAFEKWCDNRTIEAIKPQHYAISSVGPLIAYVLARRNEIKTVRIILTGKANGLSDERIRERTREMYV